MKIIVLHGDDYPKSFERIKTFQKVARDRGWEYQKVSDATSNIPEIISGQSLFVTDKLVVVDDVKLLNSKVIKWLEKNHKSYVTTLVVYADRKLPATLLKSLPKGTKIEENKLPTKLWTLLDSFYPGNTKRFLELLHEVCEKEPVELIFSLLAKQVRDMIWLLNDEASFPNKGWRATKLKQMATKFGKEKLRTILNDLSEIDVKSKSTDSELIDLLDFMVVSKLE